MGRGAACEKTEQRQWDPREKYGGKEKEWVRRGMLAASPFMCHPFYKSDAKAALYAFYTWLCS